MEEEKVCEFCKKKISFNEESIKCWEKQDKTEVFMHIYCYDHVQEMMEGMKEGD